MSLITSTLKRTKDTKNENRFIYLLFEGVVTEPYFIYPFIKYSSFFKDTKDIVFKKVIKINNDKGASNIKTLSKIAKEEIVDTLPFNKKKDKVLFIFDLDIYLNNKNNLINIMDYCLSYYIFGYTNPSIELFLLLTKENSYNEYIKKNYRKILNNKFYKKDNKRFINHLFYKITNINSKRNKEKLVLLSLDFDTAINQEKLYLNRFIDKAYNKLTSNIGYVFTKIKENKIDEINYFSFEEKELINMKNKKNINNNNNK